MSSVSLTTFFNHLDMISGRGVRPGLERITEALRRLGSPEKNLKTVHVAGTNGKGSVCSLTAQLLAESGFAVGLSLSPHVRDYRERVQFYAKGDGPRFIAEDDLLATHETLLSRIPDALGLTYFEWSIALAVKFFADIACDFVVLETGMGGRWDATNACPSIATAVTTVALDHTAELGPTTADILEEKIRIVKPGNDFLFGPRDPELSARARRYCDEVGARFHEFTAERRVWEEGLEKPRRTLAARPPVFLENLEFAVCLGKLIEARGVPVAFERFLARGEYRFPPARFERISQAPELVIDGAHNEEALRLLKRFCESRWSGNYDLVFGCVKDRDFASLAELIRSEKGRNFWAAFEAGPRTTSWETLEKTAALLGGEAVALDGKLRDNLASSVRPVLVCGSLFLCTRFDAFWRCSNGNA